MVPASVMVTGLSAPTSVCTLMSMGLPGTPLPKKARCTLSPGMLSVAKVGSVQARFASGQRARSLPWKPERVLTATWGISGTRMSVLVVSRSEK